MADQNPIVVEPTPTTSMVLVGVRQLALVGGGVATAGQLAHSHDFGGLMNYLQGDDFVTAATAGVAIVAFLYGQFRELRAKIEAIVMAKAVSDEVAIVGFKDRWWRKLLTRIRSL